MKCSFSRFKRHKLSNRLNMKAKSKNLNIFINVDTHLHKPCETDTCAFKNFNLKSKMSSNTNEMQITENAFTKNCL